MNQDYKILVIQRIAPSYYVVYFIKFSCCNIKTTAQTFSLVASVILIIINNFYLNVYKNSDNLQVILISQAKEKVYA